MAIRVGVLNGGSNLNNDYMFQKGISYALSAGVLNGGGNELEITTNQVDTGFAFVQATRDTVTPNETFLVPVEVTVATTIDTTGDGYIIVKLDDDLINNGANISAVDGTTVATVEKVASLPSKNYLTLASLASGVITDARTYSRSTNEAKPSTLFTGTDTGSANAVVVSPSGLKSSEIIDGTPVLVEINNANTGATTVNVAGQGVKTLYKNYNSDLISGDFVDGIKVIIAYDATRDVWVVLSATASISGLAKADQSEAEAGADNTKYMTPLRTKQAIDAQRPAAIAPFGGDGSDGDVSTGVTITGSNNTYILKQYDDFTPGSGTITVTPLNCIVHIKVKGDADLTNTTFNFTGKGGAGGAGGAGGVYSGSLPTDGVTGTGGDGLLDIVAGGQNGGAGASGAEGTHGDGGAVEHLIGQLSRVNGSRQIILGCGAGGGGGGGGYADTGGSGGSGGAGGAGGAGGGCLILEVRGNVTFSSTSFNFGGVTGAAGSAGGAGANSGGAGGSGAGGSFLVLYGGSASGSPTVNIDGVAGVFNGAASNTGGHGGGGASYFSAGEDAETIGANYAGSGADGSYAIVKNYSFN